MNSIELRNKFLEFFKKNGHKIIPSSSLIPTDPSVLFTTAGMQQFKPYYLDQELAKKELASLNVASVQKSLRTSDIEEVGDESHLTFFEMLGNFSFGGYFKKEAIQFAYEFIRKELGLKIDYVTIFKGEENIPFDEESEKIWLAIDPKIKIIARGKADNFWGPTGEEGPCGPTTEIYVGGVEIWNLVFNEYYQTKDKKLQKLKIPGVDTGMGLERLLTVLNNKKTVYETDLFSPLSQLLDLSKKEGRIVADHLKAAVFILAEGILPANQGRGYILRRLVRRLMRFSPDIYFAPLVELIIGIYKNVYDLESKKEKIIQELEKERNKFKNTLKKGLKEFEKLETISGKDAFYLFETFGFPFELTLELAKEKGIKIDAKEFEEEFKKHQMLSRGSITGQFKGGLADHKPPTIKLHTAHHLLLAALKAILDPGIKQRGSNINQERLRLDFNFDRKLTEEEKKKIEDWVNQKIKEGWPVIRKEMLKTEAEKIGAEMEFGAKYGDIVSVYFIGDFSKEFCGGPHVNNTSELGKFKIIKEEAVAAGIRRIKAVLE